ncbi:PP0621 family protein [Halopseudomonas sp.]|uniref:PP0621 family protein n=1 Tax=Halopseudomonas sp. TaxID=2901191 RepID=UPI003568592B
MGLIKLLVLAVVVFAGLSLWRRLQAKRSGRSNAAATDNAPRAMVRCQQCRVHIPENKALRSDQYWYCCAEHRDADGHD